MNFVYANQTRDPYYIITKKVKNGLPLFFKHILPWFSYTDEEELQMSVTLFNKHGVPLSEDNYMVEGNSEKVIIYHSFEVKENPIFISYTQYPKSLAVQTKLLLNFLSAYEPFKDYSYSFLNGTYVFDNHYFISRSPLKDRQYDFVVEANSYTERKAFLPNGIYTNVAWERAD